MRTALAALPFVAAAQAAILKHTSQPIHSETLPDSYIIKFKSHVDDSAASDHHIWVQSVHNSGDQQRLELRKRSDDSSTAQIFTGTKHKYKIGNSFRGYSGHFNQSTIDEIRNHCDVSLPTHSLQSV